MMSDLSTKDRNEDSGVKLALLALSRVEVLRSQSSQSTSVLDCAAMPTVTPISPGCSRPKFEIDIFAGSIFFDKNRLQPNCS